jgi:hypothetical protein
LREIGCGPGEVWLSVWRGKPLLDFGLGHQVFGALLQRSGGREKLVGDEG